MTGLVTKCWALFIRAARIDYNDDCYFGFAKEIVQQFDKMNIENCNELLEFLVEVSHELKILLNDTYRDFADIESERVNLNFNTRTVIYTQNLEDSCDCNNEQTSNLDCTTCNQQQQQHPTKLEFKNYCPTRASWNYQNDYIVERSNFAPNLVNHVDCVTTHNFNSSNTISSVSSTNFVNFSQYSAKPSQRQDTGYASCDEFSPFIVNHHQVTNNLMSNNQHQDHQQPECAYCSWLANVAEEKCKR